MDSSLFQKQLLILGLGNIGKAFIQRLLEIGFPKPQLAFFDSDPSRTQSAETIFGLISTKNIHTAVNQADLILLAIPPAAILPWIREHQPMFRAGQILISLAATIPIKNIKEALQNSHVHVIRLLPNPPSMLGEGMNPVVFEEGAPREVRHLTNELLNIFGESIEVKDEQMTWCVGLAGAAMRSVLPVLEGMTQAGVEAGLSPAEARRVAAQIFSGTSALLRRTEMSFDQIKALTPMQTVDEQAVAEIFVKAARQAKEKMDQAQIKLIS